MSKNKIGANHSMTQGKISLENYEKNMKQMNESALLFL